MAADQHPVEDGPAAVPSDTAASVFEFPSAFPIKVMGENVDGFTAAVIEVARQFDPQFDPSTIETRPSSGNKYIGLTVTVMATSRDQLDALYRAYSSHPMVKVVL